MQSKRWQDGFVVYIGIYLFFSPFIMGFYTDVPVRSGNFYLAGIATIALAATAVRQGVRWPSAANIGVGLWLIISPWIVGFSRVMDARNDAIALGVMIALMAFWSYYAERPATSVAGLLGATRER
jgi:hypothetical protein